MTCKLEIVSGPLRNYATRSTLISFRVETDKPTNLRGLALVQRGKDLPEMPGRPTFQALVHTTRWKSGFKLEGGELYECTWTIYGDEVQLTIIADGLPLQSKWLTVEDAKGNPIAFKHGTDIAEAKATEGTGLGA